MSATIQTLKALGLNSDGSFSGPFRDSPATRSGYRIEHVEPTVDSQSVAVTAPAPKHPRLTADTRPAGIILERTHEGSKLQPPVFHLASHECSRRGGKKGVIERYTTGGDRDKDILLCVFCGRAATIDSKGKP